MTDQEDKYKLGLKKVMVLNSHVFAFVKETENQTFDYVKTTDYRIAYFKDSHIGHSILTDYLKCYLNCENVEEIRKEIHKI